MPSSHQLKVKEAWLAVAVAVGLFTAIAAGQNLERASVTSFEVQLAGTASSGSYITPDGRYVVFSSGAALVPEDTNGFADIYIRDRAVGTTSRVSVPDPGVTGSPTQANAACTLGRAGVRYCSDDGRHVVFQSTASNLVNNDTNADNDVSGIDCFVRDRDADGNGIYDEPGAGKTRTVRVSVSSNEGQWTKFAVGLDTYSGGCQNPSISANGQYVAFDCFGDPFSPGGDHGTTGRNVYRRNRDNDFNGIFDQPGDVCVIIFQNGCITADGATTELVSKLRCNCTGQQFDGNSHDPAISGNGRYVAFVTASEYLDFDVIGDSDNVKQENVWVRDMASTKCIRASVDSDEIDTDSNSGNPSISDTGRYVAFTTGGSLLIPRSGDSNSTTDVYVRDMGASISWQGTTARVSVGSSFFNNAVQLSTFSETPFMSADGTAVAFVTAQDGVNCGLLPPCPDQNGKKDVYVRYLTSGDSWTSSNQVTDRATRNQNGADANGDSTFPSLTRNGSVVAFASLASDMITPDVNGVLSDVYVNAGFRSGTPVLQSVVSRKTHGPAGDFDVPLNLTGSVLNVEDRAGGPTQLVFTFNEPVQYAGSGPVYAASELIVDSYMPIGNDLIFNVHGATNQSCGWFQIGNFVDASGNAINGLNTVYYRSLQADSTNNTLVNSNDVLNAKLVSGQVANGANFRTDVNLDGEVDAADILRAKARINNSAPSCQ